VSKSLNPPRKNLPLKILLIEESPTDALLLSAKLQEVTEFAFDMEHVTCLAKGMERASNDGFDAVILDLSLPDCFGLDGYHKLRMKVQDSVPIIIVTGSDDRDLISEALHQGADNYLVKDTLNGNRIAVAILSAMRNRNNKLDTSTATD
jgi:two-component system sensor histidine kinase UhpB